MAYPTYLLEVMVVGGTWEVDGVAVPQPVQITGIHAGTLVKNGVRMKVSFDHHDEADVDPHILITIE